MAKVLTMVLAGGSGRRLAPLTAIRAKPAVPFGGRFRVIDFVLSNCVHSGFLQIKVLTQYMSDSLTRHVQRGWALSSIVGHYVDPVPAQQRTGGNWYLGSADAVYQNLNLVRDENSAEMPVSQVEQIQGEAYDVIESCELEGVEMCNLMPGCVPTLEWIEGEGMAMGVATSNSQLVAESVLDLNDIRRFFASVVGRRPELKMKPHPDQLLLCLEEMGVEPKQGLMVGDSVKDVQAAKAAGITMISIPSYFTKREAIVRAGPDVILENLGELPEAVSRLNGLR